MLQWTYAPELLRCPYISLSTVSTKLQHVHSVDHIRTSELLLSRERTETVEQIYRNTCLFRYKTAVVVKITFLDICSREIITWKIQNEERSFVIAAQPSRPKYSVSLKLNTPLCSRMFPSNTISTGQDRHFNAFLARNLFLTKLKYNPTNSDQK